MTKNITNDSDWHIERCTADELSLAGIRLRSENFKYLFTANGGIKNYEVQAIEVLLAEIGRLTHDRDEWAARWHRVRGELAELKYPGMKGIIRPTGDPEVTLVYELPRDEIMNEPHKLSTGHRHLLSLMRRDAQADGWAPVSKPVAALFTDPNIRGGCMPTALCTFEHVGTEGRGRARLTDEGNAVLDAMAWL